MLLRFLGALGNSALLFPSQMLGCKDVLGHEFRGAGEKERGAGGGREGVMVKVIEEKEARGIDSGKGERDREDDSKGREKLFFFFFYF